ncbi:hypothetical protein GCM10009605_57920 [Nocardiopsis composta]
MGDLRAGPLTGPLRGRGTGPRGPGARTGPGPAPGADLRGRGRPYRPPRPVVATLSTICRWNSMNTITIGAAATMDAASCEA